MEAQVKKAYLTWEVEVRYEGSGGNNIQLEMTV